MNIMHRRGRLLAGAALGVAVRSVRADATDLAQVKALIEGVQKTFSDFKAENDKALADLKKGQTDVVQTEKVDRINTEVSRLQSAIDEVNKTIAGLKIGGAGSGQTAAQVEYAKAFNRFFRKGDEPANMRDLAVKAELSVGSDPDGGHVVPTEAEQAIDRVVADISPMRGLATVRRISAAEYKKLVNLGGATSGWVGETETRTETSTPQLSELKYPAMELYAEPHATQSLLDDAAVDIAVWLADEVSIEFSEQEGDAFINGNGVAKPRGILQYPIVANGSYSWGSVGYVATGASADFAATDPADALIDLQGSLKRAYRPNSSWLMNSVVEAKVRKFKDNNKQYLWQPSIQAGTPAQLLGRPVEIDDFMPNVGSNAYPVAYGDFRRAYTIIDRIGVRVLRDPFTAKPYVKFYTTKRVGGGVQMFEAYKVLKCATS